MEFKIFVIVVTYNGMHWYDRCFGSLRRSVIPVQTVVVDNASSDNTVEFIRQNYPEITLFPSDVNLGFGQGNNKGIRYALEHDADYVFLLNQDAWIEPDTIGELVRIHKENPEYGILSPMHLNPEKTAIEKSLLQRIANYQITSSQLVNDMFFSFLKDVYNTRYVNAAAWLLPVNTLNTVGGFDPVFFHYGEDDNYLSRVLYHGMKIGICPRFIVSHDAERKLPESYSLQHNGHKLLLHEITDVNTNVSVNKLLIFHFRRMILSGMTLNKRKLIYNFQRYLFIVKNRKAALMSRKQNKTAGRNWL